MIYIYIYLKYVYKFVSSWQVTEFYITLSAIFKWRTFSFYWH